MKLKKGDTLPDAKVFIFDGSSKETSIKQIVAEEFEEQTLQTKVNDAKPEVSIAT